MSGGCILSRISRLPSRAPVSDREGLPVMRGEEKWLIKNPSLVFSSATYSGVRRVSFFSLFLSSFHPWARHTWAHTPDRRRRGGQSWQNSREKNKTSNIRITKCPRFREEISPWETFQQGCASCGLFSFSQPLDESKYSSRTSKVNETRAWRFTVFPARDCGKCWTVKKRSRGDIVNANRVF